MNYITTAYLFIINSFTISELKGRHTIATASRRPLYNHYFWELPEVSEVGKCLSMIGDWLSENYIDNLSELRQPPFFRVVFDGRQMVVDDRRAVLVGQRFSCSINNHRQPNKVPYKMNIHLILKNADDGT